MRIQDGQNKGVSFILMRDVFVFMSFFFSTQTPKKSIVF